MHKFFIRSFVSSLVLLFTFTVAAIAKDVKAAFVYIGPTGDHGWTYQHDVGRKAVEAAGYKTTYVEGVPESADAERVLRQLANSGHDVIFTTSFGYMNPTNKVAKEFPNVKFEHATGYKREHSNVSTYAARFYEGRAILGTIAGTMTKSNVIGYVASFPIPEVIRGINSFTLAAQKVNPNIKTKIVWAFTWYDPGKELSLIHI